MKSGAASDKKERKEEGRKMTEWKAEKEEGT